MSRDRTQTIVQATSFVLHGAALAAIAAISTGHVPEPIAVIMAEVAAPETPPPPSPAVSPPAPAPVPRNAPRPRAPAPSAPSSDAQAAGSDDGLPDYGIALAGVSNGPGGIAVPVGDPGGVRREASAIRQTARTLAPPTEAPRASAQRCREEETAPRQRSMPRVVYTREALDASVEGRVRLSVALDEEGHVTDASILTSLGHGLDEAALDAVRHARFEPATECGRPVASRFVLGVRFEI